MKNAVLLLFGLLLSGPAMTQDYVVWSGGVGAAEREEAPDGATRLVFFVSSGAYLSDVDVIVRDEDNDEIVNTVSNGPWLVLDLPAGDYDVTASLEDGRTQSIAFSVGAGDMNREIALMFAQ